MTMTASELLPSTEGQTASLPRKPRLTNQLLADLPEGIASLKADIEYLRDAVAQTRDTPRLHAHLQQRLRGVERTHDYLAQLHASVSARRAAGLPDEPEA